MTSMPTRMLLRRVVSIQCWAGMPPSLWSRLNRPFRSQTTHLCHANEILS